MWKLISRSAWDARKAAHLLARTGFGSDALEIEAAAARAPEEVVEELLDFDGTEGLDDGPSWTRAPDAPLRPASKLDVKSCMDPRVKAMTRAEHDLVDQLRFWWLRRMRTTARPLQEKLVLFWHGHWTTSAKKVFSSYALWLQNRTLRRFAAGNFERMARELSRDPAMMYYLDVHQNRAEAPNENFARELMELFTRGSGPYTEGDVVECARAFTGWKGDKKLIGFRECPERHDDGEKVFLSRTGRLTSREILDVLFAHPTMGVHIARQLWVLFPSEDPDPARMAQHRGCSRESGLALRPLPERVR